MEELIKDINAIPGVDGTCFFASDGELVGSSFESPTKEKMTNAGKMLIKLLSSGSSQIDDISSLSICYEESILYARRLKSGDLIIIKHSSLTDSNLISLTIENTTVSEKPVLEAPAAIEKQKNEEATPAQVSQSTVSKEASKQDRQVIPPGPISNIIAGMQRALTRIEGPQAHDVFKKALNKWLQDHEPTIANIKFLADLLTHSIEDQEKVERYRKMILPYLYLSQRQP